MKKGGKILVVFLKKGRRERRTAGRSGPAIGADLWAWKGTCGRK
jgi:hypothetical protein